MITEMHGQMNEIFDLLADELNISPTMQEKAISSYGYVGRWLEDADVPADVYPQGSFSLGTVIRPLDGNDDEYDIDLVASMDDLIEADACRIKNTTGDRLKANALLLKKMEQEGKRCWTLEYDGFHMDVLPCVPDSSRVTYEYGSNAIRLTHRDEDGLYSNRYSNPKGYREWFENQMVNVLNEERIRLSRIKNCSVEDVKTYETRTTLQKAVQILKHHRNLMFAGMDDAPISIMITTLAAESYEGEVGTFDALCTIVSKMRSRILVEGGRYVVRNPVDNRENFADKWVENPRKKDNFFLWLEKIEADFGDNLLNLSSLDQVGGSLKESIGETMASRTLGTYGKNLNEARKNGGLIAGGAGLSTTVTSSKSVVVPDHSFYGRTIG